MTCPTCQTKTQVIDSRSRDGEVYRRRVCRNGHRFSTLERFVSNLAEPRCRVTDLRKYRSKDGIYHQITYGKLEGTPTFCEYCNAWHLTPVEKTDTNFQQT
jgi:hypothetical protein